MSGLSKADSHFAPGDRAAHRPRGAGAGAQAREAGAARASR